MSDNLLFILNATLVNHVLIQYLVGVDLKFATTDNINVAWSISLALLCLLPIILPLHYITYHYFIVPLNIMHLNIIFQTAITIIIAYGLQSLLIYLSPSAAEKIHACFTIILMNAVLFGCVLFAMPQIISVVNAFIFGVTHALGFGILLLAFSTLKSRIVYADVPTYFNGAPVLLITLAIILMAISGLSGMI